MSIISAKLYGFYYNVECDKGMTPRQAVDRASKLKKLGKRFSGPVEANKHLPKTKVEEKIEKKVEEKVEIAKPTTKIKAKKSRSRSKRVQKRDA